MIKRTIDISADAAARLRVEHDQLVIEQEVAGGGQDARVTTRVPCEDVGILLIDQQRVVYSHAVMTRLIAAGACVVLCGEDHLPCGLVLPLEGNELLTQRLRKQVEISQSLERRLWREVVRAKIAAQARLLEAAGNGADALKLRNLVGEVTAGDAANVEGQAARVYWTGLLGKDFRRARGGAWPNPVLNYGYMVMRAAVARAIAGAGLHPSFGLHHHNRGNAFCLADDLVEPLRPLVDAAVVGLMESGAVEITPEVKRVMLELLVWEVEVGEEGQIKGPLMVQLHRVAASLWGCYERGEVGLALPRYEVGGLMKGGADADA